MQSLISRFQKTPCWMKLFFTLTWFCMSYQTAAFFPASGLADFKLNTVFHLAAWPLYSFLYISPAVLITFFVYLVFPGYKKTIRSVALITSLFVLIFIRADSMIYELYAFHFNRFIFNLIFTPGGIASLGTGIETYFTVLWIFLTLLTTQAVFLVISIVGENKTKKPVITWWRTAVFMFGLFLIQGGAYGYSDLSNSGAVLETANAYPLYQRVRFRSIAKAMGYERSKRNSHSIKTDTSRLKYPLQAVNFLELEKPPNIILLVAESLRWDQLTREIMPNTWDFAQGAQHFKNHYSSGNGTREGLFGLFYGLYGSYWDNFLYAQRSPILMDRLQALNYRMDLRTSARFSYPEFDKTLFSKIPVSKLHEAEESDPPWKRDEKNATELIDFLDLQSKDNPFMTFFFLESSHARYSFPEKIAIKKPYMRNIDYAKMSKKSLAKNIDEYKNRYCNSAHWLDVQLGRIYDTLTNKGLLDNTIVIITGDHGEEFMEHGSWGHNSSFVEEQTHVPMVVWYPGKEPQVHTQLTSHMDIATTLLQALGAVSDSREYSLGLNLFDGNSRQFLAVSDWHSISIMTDELKYRIPYINSGVDFWHPTDQQDHKLGKDQASKLLASNQQIIFKAIENCSVFSR